MDKDIIDLIDGLVKQKVKEIKPKYVPVKKWNEKIKFIKERMERIAKIMDEDKK